MDLKSEAQMLTTNNHNLLTQYKDIVLKFIPHTIKDVIKTHLKENQERSRKVPLVCFPPLYSPQNTTPRLYQKDRGVRVLYLLNTSWR